MTYPDEDQVLRCDPMLDWIDEHFLRPDPFAFRQANFPAISRLVASKLDVDPNGIFCIGSGAIGLSFSPKKIVDRKLKRFDKESDIDLAIISQVYFEQAWRDLLRAAQPTIEVVDPALLKDLGWQKRRLFDGAILANQMLPFLSFGSSWIAASVEISQAVAVALDREVDVNFWIYRDYWSVRNYVSAGLMRCREFLL